MTAAATLGTASEKKAQRDPAHHMKPGRKWLGLRRDRVLALCQTLELALSYAAKGECHFSNNRRPASVS
jgi:hypothetical protein